MKKHNVIEVVGFRKAYDHEIAVDDLSFHVEAGQVLGLIGPNGAGKTTTLRAISGIIPSSGGQLCVHGNDVNIEPIAVKSQTAYVPDDPQLFNDLTVRQHFAFIASAYRVADWNAKMELLLDRFDLKEKENALASALSRGMRQKLAICCAYLYEPAALLLDEPMTGLDPRGIRMLKSSILEQAQRGAAVIISSHLLAMVEDICTDVLIMEKGKKKFVGTIEQLKAKFVSRSADSTLEDIFFQAVENQSIDKPLLGYPVSINPTSISSSSAPVGS